MNLLEVYRKSSDKIDAKLVIVGTGSLKPLIKSFIQQYSLGNSILFMGSVNKEELYALYQNARALVVPSIWPENAPLVALEALSVGTPVLSSNTGGLPEIVGKVDKNSLFSNLTELEDLLLNFRKSCTSSGKIKEVYEKNFSPVAFVNNYIAAIDSIGK
jgi:glycosyltransferase involved in cell wall biosynthesis